MRRLVAALNAVWFVLSFGAPQLMHPCPEHAPKQAVSASAHSGHAAHHGSTDAPNKKKSGCCCPGPQCGSQAIAILDAVPALSAPTVALHAPIAGDRPAVERVEWLLPFATAPPASIA
jgi:hypothetical protein